MLNSIELRQQRAKLVADSRAVLDLVEKEKRSLKDSERESLRKMDTDIDGLAADITTIEKQETREREIASGAGGPLVQREQVAAQPPAAATAEFRYKTRFGGERVLQLRGHRATPEYGKDYRSYILGAPVRELRALQADVDISGGYLVAPQQFVASLIQGIDDAVFIRQLASVTTLISAESLGQPTLDADISDADWTNELGTGSEDSALKFGKRELRPHPLAKRIKVSNKLLRAGAIDPESLVRERLAYKFGVAQEKGFLLGTGNLQPLGVFVADVNGISTSRDAVTGSTTNFTADGLIDAKYALKGGYWRNARWCFHRDGVKLIRKLKDGNGQYLWGPGLAGGEPDRLLDLPVIVSEFAPNTFTTGKYVGILGDFAYYKIADALSMQVQRLVELYAEANQTGFIGRLETDGAPILEEAFIRLKTS